jgi:hypothetical protein
MKQEADGFPVVGKEKCPDCLECLGCSEGRCRVCLRHGHPAPPTLPEGITYGEYLEWRKHRWRREGPE